jgi:hypothetical protein
MNNNLTEEQQEVFNKYFRTDGDIYFAKNDINFSVEFSYFKIYRDTDLLLEIKVKDTCIAMWKQVQLIEISIL